MTGTTLSSLVERIERLTQGHPRIIVGIAGPPGAGKSTLAAALVSAMPGRAVLVAMDGFHLSQIQLGELGRADRKGAPDTFDSGGYIALLDRLRDQPSLDHFAPVFDRRIEEAIAAGVRIPARLPIIITEGNYLLLNEGRWAEAACRLDECWFLDPTEENRGDWLVQRHIDHGRSPDEAREWVTRVDEPNAKLIMSTADRADLRISSWTTD